MSRDFPPNEVEKSRRQLGAGKDFTGMAAADIAAEAVEHQLDHVALAVMRRRRVREDNQFHF